MTGVLGANAGVSTSAPIRSRLTNRRPLYVSPLRLSSANVLTITFFWLHTYPLAKPTFCWGFFFPVRVMVSPDHDDTVSLCLHPLYKHRARTKGGFP